MRHQQVKIIKRHQGVQRSSLCFDFCGRWERVLIKYTPRERCDSPYKVMPADDAAITGRKMLSAWVITRGLVCTKIVFTVGLFNKDFKCD